MNILITGETGYIAKSLKAYLTSKFADSSFLLKSIRNNAIDNLYLNEVDVLIHLAALVHKKETPDSEERYYQVNTELTYQLAIKAKSAGVKQFIFFSTMAVYGEVQGEINHQTKPNPVTFYGRSKLAAEKKLLELQDEHFKVSIVRPPMVYGPKCPGNYSLLSKLSRKTFIFPKVENKRSMLFINNLNEFIYQLIKNREFGIFHPQDPQYINTSSMVREISKTYDKSIYFSKLVGESLKLLIGNKDIYRKVFGDLYYANELSSYKDNSYQKFNLEQAIANAERE
ncbi:NAD-dependent epimerase/dehydratase family protein [Lysinibacillus sphaericus]|uniref:NAD-dependent epimerase/dehydratase family protein n=1 Tax=Lysinibacillus sphaericus TaxID=1421 RepID=UPI003F7B30FF